MGTAALRTENLTKRFGRVLALDGLDLSVHGGRCSGFSARGPRLASTHPDGREPLALRAPGHRAGRTAPKGRAHS
jgi:hypothetical protein